MRALLASRSILLRQLSRWEAPVSQSVGRLSSFADPGSATRVVEIRTEEDFKEKIIESEVSGSLAVLDFTATWCPPCKVIAPIFNSLSNEYQDVKFYKIDIDVPEVQRVAADFEVTSVPTFCFMKAGRQVDAFSGADPTQLRTLLDKHR